MNKALGQLQHERMEAEKQLQKYQHQAQRFENRINYIKECGRKERTHRLITRGAAIESIFPEIRPMTEPDFYTLMENISKLPEVKAALQSFLKPKGNQ